MPTQFIATPPPTHSRRDAGHAPGRGGPGGPSPARCVPAAPPRGRAWTWVDVLAGGRGRAGRGGEAGLTRGQPCRSTRSGNSAGSSANPVGGERDRLGEQAAEPGRVAERGQGHHRAFLVAAPPAQMLGDRAVGVAEARPGSLIVSLIRYRTSAGEATWPGPMVVVQVSPRLSTIRTAASSKPEAANAYRPWARWCGRRAPGVREHALQDLHALPVPAVDDGEARRARQRPGPGRGPEQVTGHAGDAGQVAVPGEVVGDDVDVGAGQAGVARAATRTASAGYSRVCLTPDRRSSSAMPVSASAGDQGGSGIVGE